MGPGELLDGMYKDGFHCPMADMLMGQTVENFIASERSITRDRQDDYAFASQQNAAQSLKGELFNNEYAYVTDVTEQVLLNQDEHVRTNLERDKLSSLKAVFAKDGSITAANSSGVTDGASVLTLSPERSGALVEIVDYANVALDPRYMGLGPVPAVIKLLKQQSLKIDDIALFEINEAFAAQALACIDDLQIDPKKVNVRGGVIALGHPIGATGARILTTLSHALSQSCEAGSYGIATLCVSGGMGTAILVRGL